MITGGTQNLLRICVKHWHYLESSYTHILSPLLRLIMVDLHYFIAKILNKLNIFKVKPPCLWSLTLIYFLVQYICFCFLKLIYPCSWQWFLCTFLCLLVAVNQGVLKTGHTMEASRKNWCGEVVTWSRSLSRYFVGRFQRSSQKPAGQEFERCRQNLMVGSERNRKPEWLIGILKIPWLFR